jgi:CarD family transcriptional regulator
MYGKMGACKITDITVPPNMRVAGNQLYYVMKPVHENCVIYTPVDTKVFMRPAISAEEAERLIDMIPALEPETAGDEGSQNLVKHYEAVIESHNCTELLKLTMSIQAKKRLVEKHGRIFGQTDKKYMKQAEDLLFGEISVAIGIPRDKVPDYIASRVQGLDKKLA